MDQRTNNLGNGPFCCHVTPMLPLFSRLKKMASNGQLNLEQMVEVGMNFESSLASILILKCNFVGSILERFMLVLSIKDYESVLEKFQFKFRQWD